MTNPMAPDEEYAFYARPENQQPEITRARNGDEDATHQLANLHDREPAGRPADTPAPRAGPPVP